jgi:hypothetical protein
VREGREGSIEMERNATRNLREEGRKDRRRSKRKGHFKFSNTPPGLSEFHPRLPSPPIIKKENLREWLLTKCVNGLG